MDDINAYDKAYKNAGDTESIANPEEGDQAWTRLNEDSSWVSVIYVAKMGKWYTHYDARRMLVAKKVLQDSLPAS